MNIKLYFAETPKHWLLNDAVTEVWRLLYDKLKLTYPNYNITKKCSSLHSYENGITHNHFPGQKYGFYQCIVENQDNGKYLLLNYFDSIIALHPNYGWDLENLVEIITTPGTHINNQTYKDSGIDYTPSSYIFHSIDQNEILKNFKPKSKSINNLFFRGKTYLFRKWLEDEDNRYEIISTSGGKNGINNIEFLNELASQKISLCLNGTAEITYRDIESFAVYSPVLRPILNCKFKNKLIPDYHYIGVKVDDITATGFNYYKEKADRIYKKYLEVKDKKHLLKFITNNARKWFLENGTIEANVNILYNSIDFKKLS